MNMVCTPSVSRSLPHTKSNWGFYAGLATGLYPGSAFWVQGLSLHPSTTTTPPHPGWTFRQKGPGTGTGSCACAHPASGRPWERGLERGDQRPMPKWGIGKNVTEQSLESLKTLSQIQMLGPSLEIQIGQVCAVKGPGYSAG